MVFLFLHHHNEYSYGFLHTLKIIHMGLKVHDVIKILFFFSNAMLMQKSKYAKGKNNSCNARELIWITTEFTSWRGFGVLSPPNGTCDGSLVEYLSSFLRMKILGVVPPLVVLQMVVPPSSFLLDLFFHIV
jgi:hypothetical protein